MLAPALSRIMFLAGGRYMTGFLLDIFIDHACHVKPGDGMIHTDIALVGLEEAILVQRLLASKCACIYYMLGSHGQTPITLFTFRSSPLLYVLFVPFSRGTTSAMMVGPIDSAN